MPTTSATDPLKRPFYLVGLPVAMVALSLLVFAEWQQGTLHVVDAFGLPSLVLLLGVLAFGLWRRKVAVVQLERDANTDPLTLLYNRRALDERLVQETARTRRQGLPLTVMLIDLDHFKRVNDEYGHNVGDRVLRGVSRCLSDHARKMDVVGRWGGEEFLVILPGTPVLEALETAERLRAVIEACPNETKGAITASFGIAQYRAGEAVETLLERADRTLYGAKGAGRNQVSGEADRLFSAAEASVRVADAS